MLADKQETGGAHCRVEGDSVIRSSQIAKRNGYKVVGWWHSHASHEPFHSEIDRENTMNMLNALQFTSYHTINNERELLRRPLETLVNGEHLLIKERDGMDMVDVEINGSFLLEPGSRVESVRYITRRKRGYCFALTVNAKKESPVAQAACVENGKMTLEDTVIEILDSDELLKKEVYASLNHD